MSDSEYVVPSGTSWAHDGKTAPTAETINAVFDKMPKKKKKGKK